MNEQLIERCIQRGKWLFPENKGDDEGIEWQCQGKNLLVLLLCTPFENKMTHHWIVFIERTSSLCELCVSLSLEWMRDR